MCVNVYKYACVFMLKPEGKEKWGGRTYDTPKRNSKRAGLYSNI